MRGVSWFGVVSIESNPSELAMSQAHPLPNKAPGAAAAPKLSLKESNDPKEESMAEPSSPEGSPPPRPLGPLIGLGMLLQSSIEIGHIGVVVFFVVEVHGLFVYSGL